MGNKHYQKAIQSLTKRILEHQDKITKELIKESPNEGLINHWQKEIHAFEKAIKQARKRLGK